MRFREFAVTGGRVADGTGPIDAVGYLQLGNVFAANMTGNVIFLGFRLGGSGETTGALLTTAISTAFFCAGAGRRRPARLQAGPAPGSAAVRRSRRAGVAMGLIRLAR